MVILRPSLPRKVTGWSLLVLGVHWLLLWVAGWKRTCSSRHLAARRWGWVEGRWPQHVSRIEETEASLCRRCAGAAERVRRLFSRA